MRMPAGVDTLLAENLQARECVFATVWDSVSTYDLTVVGDGVDRYLSREPDLDDESGEPVRHASGERLPEEPSGDLDESFIQTVIAGRCGFDPAAIHRTGWGWKTLLPHAADGH